MYSQEFIDKMNTLLGTDATNFFASLESPAVKGITVNFAKIPKSQFEQLVDFDIKPIPLINNGYTISNIKFGSNIFNHLGIIYSQEPSAMYPVEMLNINKGDIVLDLCAAPGGKTIQILEKLNGDGLLISNEIVYNRAKILYENINRMGFNNVILTNSTPQDFGDTNLKFDKILVDAPCGGEGMFRKNNFDFNAYNNASIETNAKRQLNILESIKNNLKNGGRLVYSTCTYDIRENEEVVANFLNNNPNFHLVHLKQYDDVTSKGINTLNQPTEQTYRRYPHLFDGEGQFMAVLEKDGIEPETNENYEIKIKGFREVYRKDKDTLNKAFKGIADISNLSILYKNDNYYAIPDISINTENLNVLSIGTLIGSSSKGILKINHTFYHTFGNLFENKIDLSLEDATKYLHGLEVITNTEKNGICVVTYKDLPLGGGKIVGNTIKNYYPKELRIV